MSFENPVALPVGGGNIGGGGAPNQIAFFTAPATISSSPDVFWDNGAQHFRVGNYDPGLSTGYLANIGSSQLLDLSIQPNAQFQVLELGASITTNTNGNQIAALDVEQFAVQGTGHVGIVTGVWFGPSYAGSGGNDLLAGAVGAPYVAPGSVVSQVVGFMGQWFVDGTATDGLGLYAPTPGGGGAITGRNVGVLVEDRGAMGATIAGIKIEDQSAGPALIAGIGQVQLGDDGGANAFQNAIIQASRSVPATAGHFYAIAVNRNAGDAAILGVNKETDTDNVPGNSVFLSTFLEGGKITIGRGNDLGNPKHADIFIDGNIVLGDSAAAETRFAGITRNFNAANEVLTVGAAGGAAALPAFPLGYMLMKVDSGALVEFPFYNHA